jgi:hypothetical protein
MKDLTSRIPATSKSSAASFKIRDPAELRID